MQCLSKGQLIKLAVLATYVCDLKNPILYICKCNTNNSFLFAREKKKTFVETIKIVNCHQKLCCGCDLFISFKQSAVLSHYKEKRYFVVILFIRPT